VERWISARTKEYNFQALKREKLSREIEKLEDMLLKGKLDGADVAKKEEQLAQKRAEIMGLAMLSPSIFAEESTMEGLREQMLRTGGIIGVFSDDARGAMQVLGGLYSDGNTREADAIKSYDGSSPIRWGRKSGQFEIYNPCMSRLEMVQKDWILKVGAKSNFFASGLLNRALICIPDTLAGARDSRGSLLRAYTDKTVSKCTIERWENLIITNLDIFVGSVSKENLGEDNDDRIVIPLDESAKRRWAEFYNESEGRMDRMDEQEKSMATRYHTQVLRIALIRVLVRAVTNGAKEYGEATLSDIEAGIRFVEYYRHHDLRFLGCCKNLLSPAAERLLRHIKNKHIGDFSKRDAQRLLGNVAKNELEGAIEELSSCGYIRVKHCQFSQNFPQYRHSATYEAHPNLLH
jgi:hypothetical protein